jgi:hypothetical protein
MKTTLNLDDTLYRRAKIKALEEGRTVSEMIEECLHLLLNGGLMASPPLQRVPLPLIESTLAENRQPHLSPTAGDDILGAQEAAWACPPK